MLLVNLLLVCVLVAVACAVLEVTNTRRDTDAILECLNNTIPVRNSPTWQRNGLNLQMSPRITISSAKVTFQPALPEDEGRYQCQVGSERSGERLLQVPPHAPRHFRHTFHGLGTNFTLPCGVEIGEISRQRHHRVQWLLYMAPPSPSSDFSPLFRYDSENDNSTMEFDSLYQFDPSNFSLHVTDFAVATGSLQQHVVYYECTVTAYIDGSAFSEVVTTNVTFEFENATILTPPPSLVVAHPGENATINFTFGGFPNPAVEWRLGSKILSGPKYAAELQHIGDSDNMTRAQLTVVGLDERDTGLLTAEVQICMLSITTSTKIVTIPHIADVKVLNSTSNDTQCGTQDLHLAFSLPVCIPVDSIQLKVNFSEVLDPGGGTTRGRFTIQTYPAQAIFNTTQVSFPITGNVAQVVEGYPRFRLQAKLIVNGVEGQMWSGFSQTIQTGCTSVTERETLRLGVQFHGGTCFSVRGNEGFVTEFSAAIQEQFHRHCTFQCERLTVEHPRLVCSSGTLGTFNADVSAYAARALVQQFYGLVEEEGVAFTPTNGTSVTLCVDCIQVKGTNVLLICVLGMAAILVFLVVLIFFLIAVAIKKRHNNSKPEDIELSPMPNVDNRPPAPLPRPSATLEVTTPHDVHVTRVHTSPHHSEALQGTLLQEILPSQLYENVTLMPLSEAGEIADQQLCANPDYAASEDTGSGAYIGEVETVPPSCLLPRTSDTLPRDEPATSDFYMKPLASSISPPVTHHSPHSTPHNTPPTSPNIQVMTSRGVSHHSTMSPPVAETCSPNCLQNTMSLAVYPSVSPGYVTHTPPPSPTCTIATMARTEPTHFVFPPKQLAKASTHSNHCASCGLPLGSMSDSRIVRPGYIPHSSALSHRSTGELKSSNPTVHCRSPACRKCLKRTEGKNGGCPGHDQPCLSSPNERHRHASLPLEDHTASKEKSLGKPCKYREQYSMHALDLRTSHESCNRFPLIPAGMKENKNGYVVQDMENCWPRTSGETAHRGSTKCTGIQDRFIASHDSARSEISDSSKATVSHCPEGHLTHYTPGRGPMGRIATEKDLQSRHTRNGYVIPVGHHQTQAFARESSESIPTVVLCSPEASKSAATPQHSTDTGLRSYSPPQVVQLPDNVVENNGELFRTQLWLLSDQEDSPECT